MMHDEWDEINRRAECKIVAIVESGKRELIVISTPKGYEGLIDVDIAGARMTLSEDPVDGMKIELAKLTILSEAERNAVNREERRSARAKSMGKKRSHKKKAETFGW